MGAYSDAFTVKRLPDGKWEATLHGSKHFRWVGDSASEVLADAGKLTDHNAQALDAYRAKHGMEETE